MLLIHTCHAFDNADSILCCCWLVHGKANGLELPIVWDCYTLYHSASCGIYAAGLSSNYILSGTHPAEKSDNWIK